MHLRKSLRLRSPSPSQRKMRAVFQVDLCHMGSPVAMCAISSPLAPSGFCDGRHKMCVYADLTDVLLNSTDRLPD
jgi:hypothetical protein